MSTWERLTRTKIYRRLWKEYGEKAHDRQEVIALADSVSRIVNDTDVLLARIADGFPEYTLHDSTHSVKIVELMDKIIPNKTLGLLNILELSLLILSAYLHDIGMVKSREETRSILWSKEFREFREQNIDILESIAKAIKEGDNRIVTELEDALITEFVRKGHGKRASEYVLTNCQDIPLMDFHGVSFAEDLALVCSSHCLEAYELAGRKRQGNTLVESFRRDKMFHDQAVNIQYIAVCLRLADIMDFDRERTPRTLFKYVSPKSKVSVHEWIKHLSINGWVISRNEIRYEAECTHPVYQNVLYGFLDKIDAELERCNYLVRDNREKITRKYVLDLPARVNRDYIFSKGFHYGPFKFSLDFSRILKLFIGEQLYEYKSTFVRELLQNSIDACRHRQAFEKKNNRQGYRPVIRFAQRKKDGCTVVSVEDNGMGMDLNILQNYFMKIGASYYRSREFEKERMGFRKKGLDFDPISRFGIGILSCFVLADRVVVETYRAESLSIEETRALQVEIEGPSEFFVVKDGKRRLYGTKVALFLTEDLGFDLLGQLRRYARHVEFPISVRTEKMLRPKILRDQGFKTEPDVPQIVGDAQDAIFDIQVDLAKSSKLAGLKGRLSLYFLKLIEV